MAGRSRQHEPADPEVGRDPRQGCAIREDRLILRIAGRPVRPVRIGAAVGEGAVSRKTIGPNAPLGVHCEVQTDSNPARSQQIMHHSAHDMPAELPGRDRRTRTMHIRFVNSL